MLKIVTILLSISLVLNAKLDPAKKRVLLIGVDGLLQTCMPAADTSAYKRMMSEGSYTYKARTAIETISGPGWSNILCGMDTEDTGISDNDWVAPWLFNTPPRITPVSGDKPFPCVFSELKINNPKIVNRVSWNWSWLFNLGNIAMPGSIDSEDFCDPVPANKLEPYIKCDDEVAETSIKRMQEDFDFMFSYFGSVDETGHMTAFCSEEYINRISGVNKNIETLFQELETLGIYENTYIIITTDHGANYLKAWHGQQDNSNMLIPFFMKGPGIKKNYELQDIVKNQDVTPTVLYLFGHPPNKIWRSRVVEEAFEDYVEIKKNKEINKMINANLK